MKIQLFLGKKNPPKTISKYFLIQIRNRSLCLILNGVFKSKNYVEVFKDITEVKIAIGKTPLKVIIEISELSKNGIVKAAEICLDAKVDFIKTSTGFTKSGATLTAVKIIRKTVKDVCKIKASGGISDYITAKKYIVIGVDRIGTSNGVIISNGKLANVEL
mgnify:CR=1 FL=1